MSAIDMDPCPPWPMASWGELTGDAGALETRAHWCAPRAGHGRRDRRVRSRAAALSLGRTRGAEPTGRRNGSRTHAPSPV